MSLTIESPVQSSSSSGDEFSTFLNAELELDSSCENSLDGETGEVEYSDVKAGRDNVTSEKKDEDVEVERVKRRKMENEFESAPDKAQEMEMKLQKQQQGCPHRVVLKGLCTDCGRLIGDDVGGVALGYIHEGLKVHTTEIDRIREDDMKKLMCMKKLILVLDLDHTLLNSTRIVDITSEEGKLLRQMNFTQDDSKRSLFELKSMHLLTKLRPYVHTFLSEASSMYDMHIYTMAERSYAVEIAKILDPGGVYFNSKIICQSDCTQRHKKGLDVVLGAESTVVILDDTETVWQRHRENLILMERYHYFASSFHQFNSVQESLLLTKKDESETDGILYSILTVLKSVHQMFFDPVLGTDLEDRDVRLVLKNIRREILQGCNVVFSRLFPSESRAEDQRIWKVCEQLGATCYTDVGPSITHVVSIDKGTHKSRWAVQNERFLVNPGWIEGAYYLWRRMDEKDFPIGDTTN